MGIRDGLERNSLTHHINKWSLLLHSEGTIFMLQDAITKRSLRITLGLLTRKDVSRERMLA